MTQKFLRKQGTAAPVGPKLTTATAMARLRAEIRAFQEKQVREHRAIAVEFGLK